MPWNLDDSRPIYSQIMEEITKRIITGKYPLGERLPSVRDLAQESTVNPNTMQKAMTELEKLKLIETKRGLGRTVTNNEEKVLLMKNKIAKEEVEHCLGYLLSLGYTEKEIKELISSCIKKDN